MGGKAIFLEGVFFIPGLPTLPQSSCLYPWLEMELRWTSGLNQCSFTNCCSEINYPWDVSQYWLYNYALALHFSRTPRGLQ